MNSLLKILMLSVIGASLIACGSRGENRKLQEAAAVHTDFMTKYDSIYRSLEAERIRVNELLETTEPSNSKFPAYQSMQRSIEKGLNLLSSWETNVAPVPGMAHDHESHAPHTHDPAKEAIIKGMSDQEIYDLQVAYKTRLEEVTKEINNLLETIKMYDLSAQ